MEFLSPYPASLASLAPQERLSLVSVLKGCIGSRRQLFCKSTGAQTRTPSSRPPERLVVGARGALLHLGACRLHQSPWPRDIGSVRNQAHKLVLKADFQDPCLFASKFPRSRRVAQEQKEGTAYGLLVGRPSSRPCLNLALARMGSGLHHPISYFFPTPAPSLLRDSSLVDFSSCA